MEVNDRRQREKANAKEESRIDRCSHALSVGSVRSGSLHDLHPRVGATLFAPRSRIRPSQKELSSRRLRLFPVVFDVVLGRFRCVMRRVMKMALCGVRVVRGCLVIAFFVVCCRFPMMACRVFVVFRCLVMMLCRLLRHSSSSFCA